MPSELEQKCIQTCTALQFDHIWMPKQMAQKKEKTVPPGRPHEYELAAAKFVLRSRKAFRKRSDDGLRKAVLLRQQMLVCQALLDREKSFRKSTEYRLRPLPLPVNRRKFIPDHIRLLDGALHSINYYDDSDDFFDLREEMFEAQRIKEEKKAEEKKKKEADSDDDSDGDLFNAIHDEICGWTNDLQKKDEEKEVKRVSTTATQSSSSSPCRNSNGPQMSPLAISVPPNNRLNSNRSFLYCSPPRAPHNTPIDEATALQLAQPQNIATGIDDLRAPMNFQLRPKETREEKKARLERELRDLLQDEMQQMQLQQPTAAAQQAAAPALPNFLTDRADAIFGCAARFVQQNQHMQQLHNYHLAMQQQNMLVHLHHSLYSAAQPTAQQQAIPQAPLMLSAQHQHFIQQQIIMQHRKMQQIQQMRQQYAYSQQMQQQHNQQHPAWGVHNQQQNIEPMQLNGQMPLVNTSTANKPGTFGMGQ